MTANSGPSTHDEAGPTGVAAKESVASPAGGAPPGNGRVPDFFIVGHHKCGTTALHQMLRSHPQIYMPELKEPRFFASDLITPTDGRTLKQARASTPLPATREEYLALFEDALPDQRMGEATALYLMSNVAADEIAQMQPRARIIALLREPTSYLRSLHLQHLQTHGETVTSFRKAIELEPARREGRHLPRNCVRPQRLLYSERVRYVEQLRRFHAAFPREQVLVLIYEDFRRDNRATVREILRFLEVDDEFEVDMREANPTVLVRPRVEQRLKTAFAGSGPVSRRVRASIERLTPEPVRAKAVQAVMRTLVESKPPPPDEEFMAGLRRRFKPEVVAVSEYLGRDLVSLWGYDALD
ncbi:MAG TPA: sulfotransferase [Solirubrobacteraceae bacterium]|nr:sulfotransferase [Solirubrobacteraceae bacterium]